MPLFKNPLEALGEYEALEQYLRDGTKSCRVFDLTDASKAHLLSVLLPEDKPWKLLITYDEIKARQLYQDISCFCEDVFLYPARDLLFFFADVESHRISRERIDIWRRMSQLQGGIIVCTVESLMDKLEDYAFFREREIRIAEGDTLQLSDFTRKLLDLGYERVTELTGVAQFSLRGGIVDVFPPTEDNPLRIELWGDEIDSIRSFDIGSQRSLEAQKSAGIYPAAEKELGGTHSFMQYFAEEKTLFVLDEAARVYERAKQIEEEFLDSMEGRLSAGRLEREEIPELFPAQSIMEMLDERRVLVLQLLNQKCPKLHVEKSFSIETRAGVSYKNAFERLPEDLKKLREKKYRVVLLTASKTRARRLAEDLRAYDLLAFAPDTEAVPEPYPAQILVLYGNLQKGFEYPMLKFSLIAESDIYGSVKKKRSLPKRQYKGGRISSLHELGVGDYVVHEEHGMALYKGIEKIEQEGIAKDYIKLEYADHAHCYIPVSKMDLIQKYASAEAKAPKLNRLGSTEWSRTKTKVKAAVAGIAGELVQLYAARLEGKGYIYPPDSIWQKEFEELFPFEETGDQLKAIEDVKADMESSKMMDRLVCGDVGYGKTEVALRAAFKAVQEGRQVIYLVPTTILAQQQYNNFVQRMKDFPVNVALLCRFRTAAEQKNSIARFKEGRMDIIIGTHRVLSKDIEAKNLGLVVIDEEQRFGVRHKEKLKQLRGNVDVLTLSATPIPRTLHMSLVGIRDLSVLEEAPIDRLPIQTYVMEYHDETVREAIKRELARNGQVYYVYNTVYDIAEVAARIQKLVPEANLAYAHGQMPERQLENIMLDFINGEIDVLVCTTIIETGLDIPNANTMLIHDADKLGLSQLYQLRGRVGRSSRTSYAFMLYRRGKLLSEEANKRLKAIREFTELGSGIKIALRDLEIRGAGNVLGAEQHGHMQAVGYDLYCKLLHTAVKALKGEHVAAAEFETTVEAPLDAYIPSSYIRNEELKLDVYKRIASMESEEDYLDIQDELMDRFGNFGKEVRNLLQIARMKALAHRVYVEELYINLQEVQILFCRQAKIEPERVTALLEAYPRNIKIKQGEGLRLLYTQHGRNGDIQASFAVAEELLKKLQEEAAV